MNYTNFNNSARQHYLNQVGYSQGRSGVPHKILLMIDYLKNESVSRFHN